MSKGIVTLLFIFTINCAYSQDSTVRITPNKEYEAGALHEFFLGEHWRNLWGTEISVGYLDLDNYKGGLTPTEKGGGLQTLSLRFKGGDGQEYKFRSINKSPRNSLPPELKESVYGDIIQDQVSIGTPVSGLITAPLLDAVGVLNAKPEMIILPDTEKLGQFRKQFGGRLGTIEVNPNDYDDESLNFAGADKVVSGFKIFEETEEDNDDRVDQAEFLKARLMDVWLGDRDRHSDQWKWARYKDENTGLKMWRPIPRDRDYAFAKYDGLLPWLSGLFAHSLVGFGDDYPSLLELSWSGRHLDRRFLNELSKEQWDSVARYMQSQLTDEVIRGALKEMPPEMYAKAGDELFNALKKRRENLLNATDEYYKVYSDVVDVYGSNKREYVEIERLKNGNVTVNVFKRDKDTGEKKGDALFSREFDKNYTSEIRLHTLGNDDKVVLNGTTDESIFIRVITEKGEDEIEDNSLVNSYWLGFTPFKAPKMMTKVYDRSDKTKIKEGPGTEVVIEKIDVPKDEVKRYEPLVEDRYSFWAFTPVFEFNSDDGFILGGGPNYTQFGFRAEPFLYYLQLTGSYSTTSSDYDFIFYGQFTKFLNDNALKINARASQLEFNRFYGLGNETQRVQQLREDGFYTVSRELVYLRPTVEFELSKEFNFNLIGGYEYSDVKDSPNTIIDSLKPYGIGNLTLLSGGMQFEYNSRNSIVFPTKGFYLSGIGTYYPKVFNNDYDFGVLRGDARGYITLKEVLDITFALRGVAERVVGTHPFYKSATLGGPIDLRGFSKERFAGDSKLLGTIEARIPLGYINLFIPGKLGLMGYVDAGRVYVSGDESKRWHSSYGGGLWLNLLDAVVLNLTAGFSKEATKFYFTQGFVF